MGGRGWELAPFDPGGCLTLARGISQDDMFRAFDLDPSTARPMTPQQVETDPVLCIAGYEEGPQWIRVAEAGGWTVAIEFIQMKGEQDNIAKGLAGTTEVVCVSFNAKEFGMISYLRDSAVVTSFLVGHPYETRSGRGPHLLDAELRAAGLEYGSDRLPRQDLAAALDMLTDRFGVSLSPALYAQPLPTAYRMHLYRFRSPGFPRAKAPS